MRSCITIFDKKPTKYLLKIYESKKGNNENERKKIEQMR